MDNSWIPDTSEQWYEWLSTEQSKTEESYCIKPENLLKDYGGEIAVSHDYEGREILELLQNAADQAKQTGDRGRIVIELSI